MFTPLNNPAVEKSLAHQMGLIVKETTEVYGAKCTIILAGGFGRGEGSVRFSDNGQPLPLHDYDLFIIADRDVNAETHGLLEKRILRGLSELTGSDLVEENFVLGMQVVPRRSLNRLPPDLSTFEMKAASKVLHGQDVRQLIPVSKDTVAMGSGAITLFHRTTALLKNVEPEYLESREYPINRCLETVYECCKVYTEICTALSLMGGFYEPSYRLRAQNFQSNYRLFPSLRRELPDLADRIMDHTNMKLRSDFSSIIERPAESWIEARRTLEICLRYFLFRFLGIGLQGSWPEFCERTEGRLRKLFFYDYLSFYLSRLGIRGSPFVHLVNLIFQWYDSVAFRRKVLALGRRPPGNPFILTSPILNVYLASTLALFSLREDGTIDGDLLKTSKRFLQRVFSISDGGDSETLTWRKTRDDCVEGQRLYFGINQKKRVF